MTLDFIEKDYIPRRKKVWHPITGLQIRVGEPVYAILNPAPSIKECLAEVNAEDAVFVGLGELMAYNIYRKLSSTYLSTTHLLERMQYVGAAAMSVIACYGFLTRPQSTPLSAFARPTPGIVA